MTTQLIVPIVIDFDHSKPPVGTLCIEETALRPNPDFVFALGYRENAGDGYTLTTVSIATDIEYGKYLKDHGIVASRSDYDRLRRALLKLADMEDDLAELRAMREAIKRLPCDAADKDAMHNALAALIETHPERHA